MRVWLGLLLGFGAAWQSTAAPKPPLPLKHGPLVYFHDHCQRCHGPFGGAYEDNFTKGKTLQELTDTIKGMAEGQGGSPLTDQNELGAQVAFHYAIDLKKPFLAWTSVEGLKVSGEVTPNAKLTASLAGMDVAVSVRDGVWHATLPAGADANNLVVTATVGDAKSTLDLSKKAWSKVEPDRQGSSTP